MESVLGKGYIFGITDEEIKAHWPSLNLNINFHFTSPQKKSYNCVAWAFNITDIDIDMLWYKDYYELDPNTLDHSAKGYAEAFIKFHSDFGFEICDNSTLEDGFEKIALYELNNDFKHIARQLPNGHWTSKMGRLEDIEHYTLDAVAGNCGESSYGYPKIFMKRKV